MMNPGIFIDDSQANYLYNKHMTDGQRKPFEPLKNIYIRTLKTDLEGTDRIPLDMPLQKPTSEIPTPKPFIPPPKTGLFQPPESTPTIPTKTAKLIEIKSRSLWIIIFSAILILITILLIGYFIIWPIFFNASKNNGQSNPLSLPSPSSNIQPPKNNSEIELSPLPEKTIVITLNNRTAENFITQLRNESKIQESSNTLKELNFKTDETKLTSQEIWDFLFDNKGPKIADYFSPNYAMFLFNSDQDDFISLTVIFKIADTNNLNSIKLLAQNWEPIIDNDINNLYFSNKGKRKSLIFSETSYGGANLRYMDYANQEQSFYWTISNKYLIFSTSQASIINVLNRLKLD